MARGYLRREGPDNSLQATALVQIAPTSSPFPRGLCEEFWWMRRAPGSPENGAAARFVWRSMNPWMAREM